MPSTSRCLRSSEQVARTSPQLPLPSLPLHSLPHLPFLLDPWLSSREAQKSGEHPSRIVPQPTEATNTCHRNGVAARLETAHLHVSERRCGGVPHIPKTRRFDPWRRPNNFWCPPFRKEFRAAVLAGHLRSSVRLCCPSSVCTIFRLFFFFSLSRVLSISFLMHFDGAPRVAPSSRRSIAVSPKYTTSVEGTIVRSWPPCHVRSLSALPLLQQLEFVRSISACYSEDPALSSLAAATTVAGAVSHCDKYSTATHSLPLPPRV